MNSRITSNDLWRFALPVVIGAISIALMLDGCAGLGYMLGGKIQTFTGRDSLLLQSPRADILDVVAEVGKSMGFSVSSLDKEAGTIGLSSSPTIMTQTLTGKMGQKTLHISSSDDGRQLQINVQVMGNFGTGGQEHATKLVDDFKTKLLEKIKQ